MSTNILRRRYFMARHKWQIMHYCMLLASTLEMHCSPALTHIQLSVTQCNPLIDHPITEATFPHIQSDNSSFCYLHRTASQI